MIAKHTFSHGNKKYFKGDKVEIEPLYMKKLETNGLIETEKEAEKEKEKAKPKKDGNSKGNKKL